MPMDLTSLTRSINKINGTPRPEKPVEPEPVTQEAAEKIWAEEAEKQKPAPTASLAEVCAKLEALEKAVREMTESLALVNKHVNATQKMLKKAAKK